MKNNTLNLPRALKFRIHSDGKIYGLLSNSNGEFYLAPEVFAILMYFAKSDSEKAKPQKLQEFLKKYFKDILANLPDQIQCQEIISDLISAGFLLDKKEPTSRTLQNDGFGDPWIQWAMIADAKRSLSYEKALAQIVNKSSIVLDVGAGTGFLSACALKLGAKKVYAIEESNISASIKPILKSLKLMTKDSKENFILYPNNSYDIDFASDINIVVSELFGNDPFQEGMYATLHDVASRIHKNVKFIPKKLEVYGEVIDLLNHPTKTRIQLYQATSSKSCPVFYKNFLTTIKKDLPFEGISFPMHLTENDFDRISSAVKLGECFLTSVSLDESKFAKYFSGGKKIKLSKTFETPVFLFWFRVYLTDDISISSHPKESDYASHWSPIAVILNKKITGEAELQVKYNLAPGNTALECQLFENEQLIGIRL